MKRLTLFVLALTGAWCMTTATPVFARGLTNDAAMPAEQFLAGAVTSIPKEAVTFSRATPSRKSAGRAFLLSLAVPGLGEWYAGGSKLMPWFIGAEAGLWGGFIGHRIYRGWLNDDLRTYAAQHAGADMSGKNSKYLVDIGNFDTIYEYNEVRGVERFFEDQYPEADEYTWNWDSTEHRAKFKSMRVESGRVNNRSTLIATCIFINHLCSAINSAIIARRWNDQLPASATIYVQPATSTVHVQNWGGSLVVSVPL
jgi:hypothetical protein